MRFLKPKDLPLGPASPAELNAFVEWVQPYALRRARRYRKGRVRDPEDAAWRATQYLLTEWTKNPWRMRVGGPRTLIGMCVDEECEKAISRANTRDIRYGTYLQERGTLAPLPKAFASADEPCLELLASTSADENLMRNEAFWVVHLFMIGIQPVGDRIALRLARERKMTSKDIAALQGRTARTVRRHLEKNLEAFDRVMTRYNAGEEVIAELTARIQKESI